ncbi:hypothetical protein AB0K21_43840 [Streptosporangium sp. NPDC049248]|uniref:hypothetical protein n=1 Tax=Streptosporangium sp. NPDC049248 TaxID=3155651 RepID=UPI0034404580
MVEQHRDAALRAFVGQLNELRDRAGSPALSHLCAISKLISENSQDRILASSTTHDILSGKRKRVPPWAWVSCFVAACTIAADRTGLDVRSMGDIEVWCQRWRVARGARPDPPAPTLRPITAQAASPEAVPHPAQRPAPAPGTSARADAPGAGRRARPPSPPATPVVFAPLPEERQRLLQIYGRTGIRLLEHSQDGNSEDCMRLAVIALLRGWPPEALHWLRRASDAGQTNAAGLFNHPHRLQVAAELACGYGRHYQCFPSKLSVAMFFYQLAAGHGHAEAAYRLAVIHQAKEEEQPADSLLGPAVADGPLPVTAELVTDDTFTQLPRDPDTVLRLCVINEVDGPTVEPPAPAGDPPLELT